MANEVRLIDANAFIEEHCADCKYFNVEGICTKEDPVCGSVMIVSELPTVDAVEVVRCQECEKGRPVNKNRCPEKYFRENCVVCECESVVGDEPMIYEPTHFCSYGERRTE